jgi:hypothetical protein
MFRTWKTALLGLGVAVVASVGVMAGPTTASADPIPPAGPATLLPFNQRPNAASFVGQGSGNTSGKALQAAYANVHLHENNAGYWDCEEAGDPSFEIEPPGNFPNRATVTEVCHPNPHV